jgi:hypothetical protein
MVKKLVDSPATVSQATNTSLGRRTFLKQGLLVTGVWGFGIRGVLAQAKQAGKPAMTAASVNRFLATRSVKDYRKICLDAQGDFKAFVRNTFYLTPEQDKVLSGLTPEQVTVFTNSLKQSVERNGRAKMQVEYLSSSDAGKQTAAQQKMQRAGFQTFVVSHDPTAIASGKKAEDAKKKVKDLEEEGNESDFFKKIVGARAG